MWPRSRRCLHLRKKERISRPIAACYCFMPTFIETAQLLDIMLGCEISFEMLARPSQLWRSRTSRKAIAPHPKEPATGKPTSSSHLVAMAMHSQGSTKSCSAKCMQERLCQGLGLTLHRRYRD